MKTPEYWAKRFNLLEQSQHDRGAVAFSEIDRKYRTAEREIERKIAVWYQRFADNNGITLQEAQKWLSGKDLEEFKWDVNQYIRYGQENAVNGTWVKQLENASARFHISRLEALKIQCQQDIEVLFGGQKDVFDQAMSDVYRSAYYRTAFERFTGAWALVGILPRWTARPSARSSTSHGQLMEQTFLTVYGLTSRSCCLNWTAP